MHPNTWKQKRKVKAILSMSQRSKTLLVVQCGRNNKVTNSQWHKEDDEKYATILFTTNYNKEDIGKVTCSMKSAHLCISFLELSEHKTKLIFIKQILILYPLF